MQKDIKSKEMIVVQGARVHNLKNIDVEIPRDSLTVITGLSGSGKSSLAFDTIYAEGQRRYIETFSAYVRNFLGSMERPDVDKITGLSPVISIEQKTTNKNPRSTVGTNTEIYDFLRLLYARIGVAYSYISGEKMIKYTEEKILSLILEKYMGKKIYILAPIVRGRKGHYKELFEQIHKKGYLTIRADGELREILPGMRLDRYKNHNIEVVIDKMKVANKFESDLQKSLKVAMKMGDGLIMILDSDSQETRHYSRELMDPVSGLSYSEPAPHNFSFNSPHGYCQRCKGMGEISQIDIDKIIPDKSKSIRKGGIIALGKWEDSMFFRQIDAICEKYGLTEKSPLKDFPEEALNDIIFGTDDKLNVKNNFGSLSYFKSYEGVAKYIMMQQDGDSSTTAQRWAEQFITTTTCPECKGQRLKQESLNYFIANKNISDLAEMDLKTFYDWILNLETNLSERQSVIGEEIKKEILSRTKFLLDVGLNYLSLNRTSASLSGGESQRIRLTTQIGSQLVNVLYILDEPSIGLHQRDNDRLISSLKQLRDNGNSILVVEHDKDIMMESDYIIDMGPFAGSKGGNVVFAGTPEDMLNVSTITADYITGKRKINIPTKRREGNGLTLKLINASGHNLKNVTATFPLNTFICVTGVSGGGKSSLINGTLQAIISKHIYKSIKNPLPYKKIEGLENINKIISVDQSPIGRTPRSNPATYTGIFGDIRNLYVNMPEAKIRGYKPGRFSFNVKGGRCEECKGSGYKSIEMNFLPNVYVPCEECYGKRYNRETLEVRFKGKSIADVLDMTIDTAVDFFDNVPVILNKIKVLKEVGLGYLKLGQSSTTLSGGESQRIKLASELSKIDTGNTIYILDEPTTGLHFEDIRVLLNVLEKLVNRGNTIIVIEHNIDVIKNADYIIDIGPEGGIGGGQIVAEGTPEQIAKNDKSFTGKYLKKEFKQ